LGNIGLNRRILLKGIRKEYNAGVWIELNWLRMGFSDRVM
jgi:hypothetical protein